MYSNHVQSTLPKWNPLGLKKKLWHRENFICVIENKEKEDLCRLSAWSIIQLLQILLRQSLREFIVLPNGPYYQSDLGYLRTPVIQIYYPAVISHCISFAYFSFIPTQRLCSKQKQIGEISVDFIIYPFYINHKRSKLATKYSSNE